MFLKVYGHSVQSWPVLSGPATGAPTRIDPMHFLKSLFGRAASDDPIPFEDQPEMPADPTTRLIVGLGNPGRQYAETRHNAGFFVVNELARRFGAPESRKRFRAEVSEVRHGGRRYILLEPQTYMNESGVAVREAIQWYKLPLDQVLIVVDDVDISFGELRLRQRGSAGGHNGLKSIFGVLGTQDIPRLRFGIGRPRAATRSYVLSRFSKEEEADMPHVIAKAADTVELWADRGTLEAMNSANDPANQPLANQAAR